MTVRQHVNSLPMSSQGFERIHSALLTEGADQIPREVTDIDPSICDGRVFLRVTELRGVGPFVVREHFSLLDQPTVQTPSVLVASVIRLSVPDGEVVVDHGRRFEHYTEQGLYREELVNRVRNPRTCVEHFQRIATVIPLLEKLREERSRR